MKLIRISAILFAAFVFASASQRPRMSIRFQVRDDLAKPQGGLTINASTFDHWRPGDGFGKDVSTNYTALTDKNGNAVIEGTSVRGDVSYVVAPAAGFYRGGGGEYRFSEVSGDKWEPWSPRVDVVVKRIIKPIPMYARRVGQMPNPLQIPAESQPVSFDLIAGDWVTPFGRGSIPDLIFNLSRTFDSVDKPFDATLTVKFSNDGDGIQAIENEVPSEFKSPRYAPDANYDRILRRRISRSAADKAIVEDDGRDRHYFFRVRTILNRTGQVESALYGKIYDGLKFDIINGKPAYLVFTYYLNPTPNDRNMEFDPRQNLFKNLTEPERPTAP